VQDVAGVPAGHEIRLASGDELRFVVAAA